MKYFCEIGFTEDKEFIVLPKSSILNLIQIIRTAEKNHSIRIKVEQILPPALMKYIEKVININRSHKKFAYNYIKESSVADKDLLHILARQLGLLTMDNKKCFTDVAITESETLNYFTLWFNPVIRELLFNDKTKIMIKEYNL